MTPPRITTTQSSSSPPSSEAGDESQEEAEVLALLLPEDAQVTNFLLHVDDEDPTPPPPSPSPPPPNVVAPAQPSLSSTNFSLLPSSSIANPNPPLSLPSKPVSNSSNSSSYPWSKPNPWSLPFFPRDIPRYQGPPIPLPIRPSLKFVPATFSSDLYDPDTIKLDVERLQLPVVRQEIERFRKRRREDLFRSGRGSGSGSGSENRTIQIVETLEDYSILSKEDEGSAPLIEDSCIIISNISRTTSESDLLNLFESVSPVAKLVLLDKIDKEAKGGKGGVVLAVFTWPEQARKIKEKFNRSILNDNVIIVELFSDFQARFSSSTPSTSTTSTTSTLKPKFQPRLPLPRKRSTPLIIQNLPFGTQAEDVEDVFWKEGFNTSDVWRVKAGSSFTKVFFREEEEAKRAVEYFAKGVGVELKGKKLEVGWAYGYAETLGKVVEEKKREDSDERESTESTNFTSSSSSITHQTSRQSSTTSSYSYNTHPSTFSTKLKLAALEKRLYISHLPLSIARFQVRDLVEPIIHSPIHDLTLTSYSTGTFAHFNVSNDSEAECLIKTLNGSQPIIGGEKCGKLVVERANKFGRGVEERTLYSSDGLKSVTPKSGWEKFEESRWASSGSTSRKRGVGEVRKMSGIRSKPLPPVVNGVPLGGVEELKLKTRVTGLKKLVWEDDVKEGELGRESSTEDLETILEERQSKKQRFCSNLDVPLPAKEFAVSNLLLSSTAQAIATTPSPLPNPFHLAGIPYDPKNPFISIL